MTERLELLGILRNSGVSLFLVVANLGVALDSHAASPRAFDRNCRASLEKSIISAGFSVQPTGYIITQIRKDKSVDQALSRMWASSRVPAEIASAEPRGNGKYYVNITIPPSQSQGLLGPQRSKIAKLQATLHQQTACIQTLRIGLARSGPYQCTWLDPNTRSIRQIEDIGIPDDRRLPRPGLDYCE